MNAKCTYEHTQAQIHTHRQQIKGLALLPPDELNFFICHDLNTRVVIEHIEECN